MKRNIQFNLLIFLLFFGINFSFGQVTIAVNSFEPSGDTWTPLTLSTPTCTNGGDRWDYSASLNSISANDGSQFWGIQDLNGNCGGSGYETITHPSIDISAYTNVVISFDYFTKGYDGPDYLGYEIWEDGTKVVDLTNLNKNSNSWVSVSYNVTAATANAYLVLKAKQDGGSDYAAFDNVKIIGTAVATNDTTSEVSDLGLTQPSAANISSVANTNSNNPLEVFKLKITDINIPSGDGLPTKVTNIRIKPFTTNTADWTNTIQGIVIDDGVAYLTPTSVNITDAFIDITLANTELMVTDGGTKDVNIAIYLNSTNVVDGEILSFMVDAANHGFTADASGSDFVSSLTLGSFNSNNFTIDVIATELQFTQQPTDVEENAIMTPAVTVAYTDANGNIDVDYSISATLTALGTNLATSTTTAGTFTNGVITFNDIEFTSANTGVTLTVTDNTGIANPNVTSNPFDVTATPVGCTELFFSEYIEGSGNNKYLEIFNPTAADIDLTDYDLVIYNGSSNSPSITIQFTTAAVIPSNGIYVLEHSLASSTLWTGTPNQIVSNLSFNGNDPIALRKSGTNIDVIGTIGSSSVFGEDVTLVRKKTVAFSNTTYTTGEWDIFSQNTVSYLGAHSSFCPCSATTSYTTLSGWSNGIPNETTKVIFTDSYNTSTANINACRCLVESGATLTIAANSYIKVLDSITNKGNIHVLNQGSVVQVYDNAVVSGTGVFNTKITTTNLVDDDRFTYFSSPVEAATLNDFSAWADMNYLWDFVGSTQDWSHITDVNTAMVPATGYIVQPSNGTTNATPTTTFVGSFNNGVKTHDMFFEVAGAPDATDASNALVGNPYPSAINSHLLFQKNPQLGGIYIWNHDSAIGGGTDSYGDWVNNDYIVCADNLNCTNAASSGPNASHNGYIASGQGFFAIANVASPTALVFNNSMRVTGNNTDFRRPADSNTEKLWLNLTSSIGYFNQSLFIFSSNGTAEYNNQADAKRLGSEYGLSIYSLSANTNKRLAVDDRGEFQSDVTIPLGYYLNNDNANNLTFSIDHFENLEDVNVYIKDNLLNTIHNLKIADYNFSSTTGIFDTRFELLFSRTALEVNENLITSNNQLVVTNLNDTQFKVTMLNNTKISSFKVFDVLGKLVIETKPNATDFIMNNKISKGSVLFAKATLENGQVLTRKFIK